MPEASFNSTELHPASAVKVPNVQVLRCEVIEGSDKGRTFDLDADPVRIGSAAGCDVTLSDRTVSGVHLELRRSSVGVAARDLGSRNGTFVGALRIKELAFVEVTTFRLGGTALRITPLAEQHPVALSPASRFGDLVGESPTMRALFAKLERTARSDATVLLTGETGTGKELAAAAIQAAGSRADKPFVVVDCGALSVGLATSELLGHMRGAFTGADREHRGAFERAHTGTIFLDEIGELPLDMQPTLLGILERREAARVGGEQVQALDVRVIAATNRDLASCVRDGTFRADLYHRLAIVEIALPPLRDHVEDIPLLVQQFTTGLGAEASVDRSTLERLQSYPWPGNIRELRNVVERMVVLQEGPSLDRTVAPPGQRLSPRKPLKEQRQLIIEALESDYVREVLELAGGNISEAARRAGVGRVHMYRLIEKYGIRARTIVEA